jgi:SWI/SNF related-matrix-associated actin-dependent regulator of chromatin subfamily C
MQTPKTDLNLEIRRNVYDPNGKELGSPETKKEKPANGEESTTNGTAAPAASIEDVAKEPKKQFNCFSCGVDCTRVRYHSAKSIPTAQPVAPAVAAKAKFDLCPNCFLEGRFPSSSSAVDFIKLEDASYSSIPDRNAPWSDGELLLLLEGLELFDDDWNSIADHIGTRTREECVLKFLQLEIEDKYLEGEPSNGQPIGTLHGGRMPYTQSDNPVMSVVGFLAGMTDQHVAAAAAGKTVEELRKSLQNQIENGTGKDDSEKTKEKGKAKEVAKIETVDSMDVDAPSSTALEVRETSVNPLATIPLAISAGRASGLASHEEREMTRLISTTVNATLQKLEQKLQHFNEFEDVLSAERRELERGRQQLFLDRLAFKKRVQEVEELLKLASLEQGERVGQLAAEAAKAGVASNEKLGFVGGVQKSEIDPFGGEAVEAKAFET